MNSIPCQSQPTVFTFSAVSTGEVNNILQNQIPVPFGKCLNHIVAAASQQPDGDIYDCRL